ncbi:MAG: glycine dehydrogenase, partial [Chthoniobacterales bacterium]
LEELIDQTVPEAIRFRRPLTLPEPLDEHAALAEIRSLADENMPRRSFIGMGYHNCHVPPVILRNVLENPGWYTAYTPYQAELAQGRLEALLNFQTMVSDLTGMEIANASLLDESTAAAEAMAMAHGIKGSGRKFFVADNVHPQTIALLRTRAEPLGIEIVTAPWREAAFDQEFFGALVQYPATDGAVEDYGDFAARVHAAGAVFIVAADLLALNLLKPPGEFGADIVVGSAQRFGVPLGYGGPHAAFLATKDEHKRRLPGRLVGVSKDADGNPAMRLSLQTREQHIRRDKATSNICTAQVLLAVMASMYAVYHGPKGLLQIARRTHGLAALLARAVQKCGYTLCPEPFFDTLCFDAGSELAAKRWVLEFLKHEINIRHEGSNLILALDEASTPAEVAKLAAILSGGKVAWSDLD